MKKELYLLVDSHHGIYSAQSLVQRYGNNLQIDQEDKDILLAGPDHPWYVETWATIDGAILVDDIGEKYFLWQNEDIWAVPEGWEYNEEDTYMPV